MGIFDRLTTTKREPELSPDLVRRLIEIEERQRLQEKGLKSLELDWQEWFDKFRLLYARLSKRIRDAAQTDEQSRKDDPESTNDPRAVSYDRPYLKRGGAAVKRNY
jgi:hypothetical protein